MTPRASQIVEKQRDTEGAEKINLERHDEIIIC